MSLTDKLTAEKAGLESYLDSERGAKLEQSQIDRLDTLNSLLGIGSGGVADTTATGTITTENLVPTGAATAGSTVSIDLDSKGTVTIQVTGTYTGALSAQITTDGTNWVTPTNAVFKNMVTGANSATIPSASVGIWQIEVIGHAKFRLSALAAVTGTATVALRAAANTSQVSVAGVSTAANQTTGNASLTSIDSKIPALGQALAASSVPVVLPAAQLSALTPLSSVGITGSVGVTGTFWQTTQPVSLATLPSITANTSIEYGAGASTAKTQRVVVADFTPKVKELTSALITRTSGLAQYSIGDSYGGRGVFTNVGSIGQSLFINDFQVIIDITAIPASMALSVRFFTTEADTQVTGAPVSDNSLLTATLPNTATPADGYPLTITVSGDKVFAFAKNIKFITPLEATSLWFYLRCNVAFTPAANSETMTAKASCEVY
jgi:hypothetical protein